jgi:3-hydroxymyristoyl/3-hydroxydecanoyl-(acyl carrier protein) dehydratase
MCRSKEVRFPADHPTAAGHFPARPVIPGVLLLDEAIKLALPDAEGTQAIVIRSAKFHSPVQPGDAVIVRWEGEAGSIRFECRLAEGDILVASGTLGMEGAP